MSLTWPEIRARAGAFARDWKNVHAERAEAQTFWNEFFAIFGLSRRRVAAFEVPVKIRERNRGFIDLFWSGVLLVEHKSRGEDLGNAHAQATSYFHGLEESELPRHVLVSDFARFSLRDLDTSERWDFKLSELPNNIRRFAFILGQATRVVRDPEPANRKAAELMGELHDALEEVGFTGHDLEVFLVRLLFCFFADDIGIFEPRDQLHSLLARTAVDGSDLGALLVDIFEVLNTHQDEREKTLDPELMSLRYINGGLFKDRMRIPHFDRSLRQLLLDCAGYDWTNVDPVIFGALFQSVSHVQANRRKQGMHYTSEQNILKVIGPLFLNALQERFERNKRSPRELKSLLTHIKGLRLLDPACGCGNFLVVAYRELRQLELRCHEQLQALGEQQQLALIAALEGIDVDNFYGIEVDEFPAQIARTALWLVDHQMNIKASELAGEALHRLPLAHGAKIEHGNALQLDWNDVLPAKDASFVLGNPPFIGRGYRDAAQRKDMENVFPDEPGFGDLDYVCAWYAKAAAYLKGTSCRAAFVSTNSISQGEQVGTLWRFLHARGISIRFAHRTFRWSNEARNNANVFVVIIGFAWGPQSQSAKLSLFDYETVDSEPVLAEGAHINPYLILHADDTLVASRRRPICQVPPIVFGSMPNDGSRDALREHGEGNLILGDEERTQLLSEEPRAGRFLRRFFGAEELLDGTPRWCLWLRDIPPVEWRDIKAIRRRVDRVRAHRVASQRGATQRLSETPALFGEDRQPDVRYIAIPSVSSERRRYIPMAFAEPDEVASNLCLMVPGAELWHFGVLQSDMHMAWVRHVCGRLKSDFRYSNEIVYNNFPWPQADARAIKEIGGRAQQLLNVREGHLAANRRSYAAIYDPDAMPVDLLQAHRELSRAVDKAYDLGRRSVAVDRQRMEFLLERYAELVDGGDPQRPARAAG